MQSFILNWLPVMVYCIAIFVQSSYPSLDKFPSFAYSDKLMHVIAYGLLGLLVCRAVNTLGRWRHRWGALVCFGVAAAALYGASDEWHQSFVAGRSSEVADLIADVAGGLVGSVIYVSILYMRCRSAALNCVIKCSPIVKTDRSG
jgi:VanZ family protein